MGQILNFIDGLLRKVVTLAIGLMLSIIFIQVVLRYAFHFTFSFSEELARYLFVWTVFLCIPVVAKTGGHMAVGAITERVQGFWLKVCQIAGGLLTLLFSGILFWQGVRMVRLTQFQTSPALGIKMSYVYLAIPLGAAVLLLISLMALFEVLRGKNDAELSEGGHA
ncbi:MAG TPA: TRAP transporter small permease [Synergistaceae bacterium]|nr:TRAP transporter small permease [Synergistaceae bacterium]HPQ38009.1 TRAP transporter small permease [Synergistaceae bacterium]